MYAHEMIFDTFGIRQLANARLYKGLQQLKMFQEELQSRTVLSSSGPERVLCDVSPFFKFFFV